MLIGLKLKLGHFPGNRPAFNANSNRIKGANSPEGVQIQMNFIKLEFWTESDYGPNIGPGNNDPNSVSSNNPATNLLNIVSKSTVTDQLNIPGGGVTP